MRLTVAGIKIKSNIEQTLASVGKVLEKNTGLRSGEYSDLSIVKKSIDARKKPDVYFVYQVAFDVAGSMAKKLLNNKKLDAREYNPVKYEFPVTTVVSANGNDRPVIVGFGPAGMICGLYLAKAGLRPIIVERGCDVDQRIKDVEAFWQGGKLDTNSNIQFGEGGAGTFSDGKLQTGVKDKTGRIAEILGAFVEHGAPEEILYLNKPHIGTDKLITMVKNIREHIIELGGEVRFNTKFIRPLHNNFTLTGGLFCKTSKSESGDISQEEYEIETRNLILALGHSSRDTFLQLDESGIEMTSKPFAVGLRVQHKQETINVSQYGEGYDKSLPASDYKLTYTAKSGRGVYSFCMCPGGYVVNASSEQDRTAVNGMSYHDRSGDNANSAIIITVDKDIFGENKFDGMHFQEELEEKAYAEGVGKVPVQTLIDYKNDKASTGPLEVAPAIKGEYVYANNRNILPDILNQDIIEAFSRYGQIIKGFDTDGALLCGVETRTSSPVKILRDDDFMSNMKGLYPCGEGAGYAGGITSAALDGLKVAEKVVLRYN